jgi:hypothetical protein
MEVSLPNHYSCFVGRLGFHGDPFGMDCSSVSTICTNNSSFTTFAGFHGDPFGMDCFSISTICTNNSCFTTFACFQGKMAYKF